MEPKREASVGFTPEDKNTLRKREAAAPRHPKGSQAFRLAEAQMANLKNYPGARWAFRTVADIATAKQ